MTTDALQKARTVAQKAAQELADLETVEAEKAAQRAAQRLEEQKAAAARFLGDLPGLERRVKGEKPSAADMATALEAGTLGALVADFLARRDAVSTLRDHARQCSRLLGEDDSSIAEIRYVDPGEEFRRWNEDAIAELRRTKANSFAADVLSAYGVE
ncbi:hypothetical protein TPA0910_15610 [Streptomyces hygroscopicus subsp. sporocinereus]|uniref:Uncharacterized protein n=1 Tax=Streptomyces hygroscopicus TaxID=1912 RepID=A0ABQ3TVZ1_STRHY|nr:hypothetical protein [Streptomyces hygroscopicus]GHJ27128.1 hypothetical protein TPA0910_15610 [Streptomyces hygroscopicus]